MGKGKVKGPVRAVRHPVVSQAGRPPVLSRALEEELFRIAEVLTEGGERDGVWYGSTMITFDLARLTHVFRQPPGPEAFQQLQEAIAGSVRAHIRVMRIAREEVAHRFPGRRLGTAIFDMQVSLSDDCLHADADIEIPLSRASRFRQRGQ